MTATTTRDTDGKQLDESKILAFDWYQKTVDNGNELSRITTNAFDIYCTLNHADSLVVQSIQLMELTSPPLVPFK